MTILPFDNCPSDWTRVRLGQVFEERREKVSDRDFSPLSVTMKGVVPQLETVAKTDDGDNRKRVCAGDLVINSRSDRKGSSGLSPLDGSVSLINLVLKLRMGCPRYLHHLLRSPAFQEEFYRWGHGIVADLWTTRFSDMKAIWIALPPEKEQVEVASFLDRETARIDGLVAKQQEFLATLDEHWRAAVTSAVTGGLMLDARRRATGVVTFPEAPSHWDLRPLMRLVPPDRPINYGVLMPGPNVKDGIPLIEAGDVMAGQIRPDHLRRTTLEIEAPFARSRLKPGDVVVAIRGSVGTAEVVPPALRNANVTRDAARISPKPEVDAAYLAFVIGSHPMQGFFASRSLGAAVQGINIADLKRAPIPLPPLAEQKEIAARLNEQRIRLIGLRSRATEMIERLREHRTALITAAVTGGVAAARPLADRRPAPAQVA